jgi:hypothetical protein
MRAASKKSSSWFSLSEFAVKEADINAFRDARHAHGKMTALTATVKEAPAIDWAAWEGKIQHKSILESLKNFQQAQSKHLDDLIASKQSQKKHDQVKALPIYQAALAEVQSSVEDSEKILQNAARALYISFNNPSSSQVTQQEWLDVDQYWQAFYEKHMHYANYLNVNEDPESKEALGKQENMLLKQWQIWDGRNEARLNNKLLYQRPSFEFYDVFRSILIEHGIFYLAKTGSSINYFPEVLPYKWHAEYYDKRFSIIEILQKRRRQIQLKNLEMERGLELSPEDPEHDGFDFYSDLVQKENSRTEIQVGKLMANFIFLNDAIPIQSESALLRVDEETGSFYSLGDDINCIFYRPKDEAKFMTTEVSPVSAYATFTEHSKLTGVSMGAGEAQMLHGFHELLEGRKDSFHGRWFRAENESTADAFLRRLSDTDSTKPVYEEYVKELKIPAADVLAAVKKVAEKAAVEIEAIDAVFLGSSENSAVKEATASVEKRADIDNALSEGTVTAFAKEDGKKVTTGNELKEALKDFELENKK